MPLHPPNQQTISLLLLLLFITTFISLTCSWHKAIVSKELEYYQGQSRIMSRRSSTTGGDHDHGLKLDLKLNLSPPRTDHHWPVTESPNRSPPTTLSPTNSCVSLEQVQDDQPRYSSSPETTSMILAGCPRCLMYVMLAGDFPKCPKCKSSVLLDVVLDKPMKKMRN